MRNDINNSIIESFNAETEIGRNSDESSLFLDPDENSNDGSVNKIQFDEHLGIDTFRDEGKTMFEK